MDLSPESQQSILVAGDFHMLLGMAATLFTAFPAIRRTKTVGRRSPLPNIAACFSCCVGMLYACARKDQLAIAVNAIGASFQAIYIAAFICYSDARRLVLLQCVVPAIAYMSLLAVYLAGEVPDNILAVLTGACGCLAPATIAYILYMEVRRDATMESMPHRIVPVIALVCSPLCIMYGFAGNDDTKLYIAIPNGLDLASALIQLFLHFLFFYLEQLGSDLEAALRDCLLEY